MDWRGEANGEHRAFAKYKKTEAGLTGPCTCANSYFFLAAFFLPAFFFAFFFAAIIVSYKVNLGIVSVRRLFRTTIAQLQVNLHLCFVAFSELNSKKLCLVRQF